MTADPDLMLRLAKEAAEDDARMSPDPWIAENDVLYSDTEADGTIQLAEFSGEALIEEDVAVARQRNNLRQMAEQLRLAAEELKVLRKVAKCGLPVFGGGTCVLPYGHGGHPQDGGCSVVPADWSPDRAGRLP